MAAFFAHLSLFRRGAAAIVAACLLLQMLAMAPAHASAGGLLAATSAPLCGSDAADGAPASTPAAPMHCAICAVAAALPAPVFAARLAWARVAERPSTAWRGLALARAPPGWTSSWSSQAPPRRA
ncbi:hypothetical+protein [Methylocapsa aurea]|uniref:hypothetical protein n=1 Tax=Methylocapsa aurea TaxID=663610 RepID=UPI003D188B75